MEEPKLPSTYYLDESDPDILILRRQDDTFVAAFSAQGATRERIVEAAMEDYKTLKGRKPAGEGEAHDSPRVVRDLPTASPSNQDPPDLS
jgi:hypothetical protein